jgi:hypothetical protein
MTRVEWWGKHMEYASRGELCGFGPQNTGGGSEKRMIRGGTEELALRLSYLMKGTVAVGSWFCRVGLECSCG